MKPGLRRGTLYSLLLVLLVACSSDEDKNSSSQQYYFLEALQQVESGGRQLQAAKSEAALLEALAVLDQGLKLAFEVKRDFLDQLDLRLGKNFQRYFVKGVENYRLGIEAGDPAQQREGLQLLAKWGEFWALERDAILARLEPE